MTDTERLMNKARADLLGQLSEFMAHHVMTMPFEAPPFHSVPDGTWHHVCSCVDCNEDYFVSPDWSVLCQANEDTMRFHPNTDFFPDTVMKPWEVQR